MGAIPPAGIGMSDLRPRIRIGIGIWIALVCFLLVLAVIPQRYIPDRFTPFVATEGRFAGEPVRLAAPVGGKPEAPISIKIDMDEGECLVSLESGGERKTWFSMGEGTSHKRIPAGSEVVLDPQGNPGNYEVTLGPPWHPLAPRARRLVFLPAAILLIVVLLFAGRLKAPIDTLGTRRLLFLAAILVLSAVVLYPVVHEGGHLIGGILCGATPDWDHVTWTNLLGEEPRASFSHLPERAVPWMTAAGHIVPTLVALLLLVVLRFVSKKASWYVSATLVTIPILFLLGTVGCVFELYRNTHMDSLSVHFELSGVPRVLLSLSPLLVAIAAYVWLGLKLRETKPAIPDPS